ncbi:MAG: hypothetical protein AB7O43_04825 [Hyphomicrobiaceae bacterium]
MSQLQATRSGPSAGRKRAAVLGIWLFPYLLAAAAYFGSLTLPSAASLQKPVFDWPIPSDVYGWLLLMLLLAIAWLVAEFISVSSRETTTAALQWDGVISTLTAVVFTGLAGWLIGKSHLPWWIVIPWLAAIVDALTASWLGINNAAQKPFLSQRGSS